MTKVTGPDFVALQVRDLARSRRFYTEHLGLEIAPQSPPNAVVFQTVPIPFAVREPAVDLEAVPRLGWGVALWLACDDADALPRHSRRQASPSRSGPRMAPSVDSLPSWTRTATP